MYVCMNNDFSQEASKKLLTFYPLLRCFLIMYSLDNYSNACYMKHQCVSYISNIFPEIIILLT